MGASPAQAGAPDPRETTPRPELTTEPKPSSSPDPSADEVGLESGSVTRLQPDVAARRAELDPYGALEGLQFEDGAGTNFVLLRRRANNQGGAALLADHVVYPNSRERLVLREVRDGVSECEVDMVAEFVSESLQVTDFDDDGYDEVSFAYRLNCSGDPSPDEQKLLVLEEGKKYILRGSVFSPYEPFEDPRPEPAPSAWPPGTYDDALFRFRNSARN